MTKIELMKLKAELARVESGKAEQEYQIAMRMEEIERLEKSIEASDARVKELKEQLKQNS
jgi:predicted  nucleic acid-binding Zn-ribbon protein